jgi:hypothetical protein
VKKNVLDQIANEISKYRIEIKGLSLLPFSVDLRIIYLPSNEEVGYIKWFVFKGVEGEIKLKIDDKSYYIRYKNGDWTISEA